METFMQIAPLLNLCSFSPLRMAEGSGIAIRLMGGSDNLLSLSIITQSLLESI